MNLDESGHIYQQVPSTVSWNAAFTLASIATYRGVTGHLVVVDSSVKAAFLHSFDHIDLIWNAANDLSTSGVWKYVAGPNAGTVATYTNWYFGEPAVNSGFDCVHINTTTTAWYSGSCDHFFLNYVVEYECATGMMFGPTGCIGLP